MIAESVTEIGYAAFAGCINLKEVELPISLTEVGQDVLRDTEWKQINTIDGFFIMSDILWSYEDEDASVVNIPLGVKLIADGAFYESNCKKVVLPDTVKYIGQSAFAYSENLRSVYLPESIIKMGIGAFYFCTSLEEIVLPDSLMYVPEWTFYGCSSLKKITFSINTKIIGEKAFFNVRSWKISNCQIH